MQPCVDRIYSKLITEAGEGASQYADWPKNLTPEAIEMQAHIAFWFYFIPDVFAALNALGPEAGMPFQCQHIEGQEHLSEPVLSSYRQYLIELAEAVAKARFANFAGYPVASNRGMV